jgi:hypothetical protein
MITIYVLAAAAGLSLLWLGRNVRVVKQFERGVVFRFGRVQSGVRGPGLTLLIPIADRLQKVNMQIITMPVPAQDGITRDNVTVRVDAVIYFNVVDPVRAAVDVQDYTSAVGQVAQTSLRSIIGKSNLDDLLSNRERLNQGLELLIDSPALGWGIHIDRVEIKDVVLPDSMKRSIARQAEPGSSPPRANCRRPKSWPKRPRSWPNTRRRCNCGSWKPSSRSRQRRTPPSCCLSPSNCFGSWNDRHHQVPSTRTRRSRHLPMRYRIGRN